ncbi:MAG: hypothetical protein ACI8X5_000796 [Planctomycetota bacterium]|jgi:hypothetical protein
MLYMSSNEPMMALMRGKLEGMKELQALLKKRGITSEIRRPDEKGGSSG